jgi:hypothetical protein
MVASYRAVHCASVTVAKSSSSMGVMGVSFPVLARDARAARMRGSGSVRPAPEKMPVMLVLTVV